jgi:putative flippase GtrA
MACFLKAKNFSVFIRYVISGAIASAAHFSLLILLVELISMNATLASAVGFGVAIFVNYSFQYHWTFRADGPHGVLFARYIIVTFAMLGVNTGIFWFFNVQLDVPYLLAQVVATGIVVLFNFTINLRYTFNISVSKVG